MAQQYYVEVYSAGTMRPREYGYLPDFAAMMDRVHEFRFRQTTDKLRFIAPASSTDAERRELQMAGAVAG